MSEMLINQTEDRDTLGGRISRAREAAGLSLNDLARNVGVTRKTIEGWETDALEPRSNRLNSLAGVLGVSPTWLLQGIGTAPRGEVEDEEMKILQAQIAKLEATARDMSEQLSSVRKSLEALSTSRGDD
ncbi:helix-turn-helix domain-containing protein [Pseudahrensia aquimaris]|uniref:Helix-turn-helix domain-containing protein n=1 Tax=Pseudahrensia aquimaris TaxID=744461 RepID=A0ABW3FBW6_9HYPH